MWNKWQVWSSIWKCCPWKSIYVTLCMSEWVTLQKITQIWQRMGGILHLQLVEFIFKRLKTKKGSSIFSAYHCETPLTASLYPTLMFMTPPVFFCASHILAPRSLFACISVFKRPCRCMRTFRCFRLTDDKCSYRMITTKIKKIKTGSL